MKIKELKQELDKEIRQYFLNTWEKNDAGEYFCPLKRKWFPESEMQVAHFIDRNVMSTRYKLMNLILCSKASNVWDSTKPCEGYKSIHHRDYEEYIGPGAKGMLEKHAKKTVSLGYNDLYDILNYYQELNKQY